MTTNRKLENNMGMEFNIETITPEMAADLLRRNENNRTLKSNVVNGYAKQMQDGQWKMNGECIRIDVDGNLADGQHRLAAIVKYGHPVQMGVVRNVPKDAIKTIDTGRARTAADNLKIHGYVGQLPIICAALNIVRAFDKGVYIETRTKDRMTPTVMLELIENHKGIMHSEQRISQSSSKLLPRGVSVALHYIFSQIDRVKADVFFQQLFAGTDLHEGSPVLALRNKLIQMASENKRNMSARRQYIFLTVNAFKAFTEGRKIERLRYDINSPVSLELEAA
jgi:hypothetical protein